MDNKKNNKKEDGDGDLSVPQRWGRRFKRPTV